MSTTTRRDGVSGKLSMLFAIPTDDPATWHMRHGALILDHGATVEIEVSNGYIPSTKGKRGLSATYYVFSKLEPYEQGFRGDITMMTCVDGSVMGAVDVANNVNVIPTEDFLNKQKARANLNQERPTGMSESQ
jgi:hypothetical protein